MLREELHDVRRRALVGHLPKLASIGSHGFVSSSILPSMAIAPRITVSPTSNMPLRRVQMPDSSPRTKFTGLPSFECAEAVTGSMRPPFGRRMNLHGLSSGRTGGHCAPLTAKDGRRSLSALRKWRAAESKRCDAACPSAHPENTRTRNRMSNPSRSSGTSRRLWPSAEHARPNTLKSSDCRAERRLAQLLTADDLTSTPLERRSLTRPSRIIHRIRLHPIKIDGVIQLPADKLKRLAQIIAIRHNAVRGNPIGKKETKGLRNNRRFLLAHSASSF